MSDKKQIYVIGPSNGPLKIGIAENAKSRRSILNVGNHQYLRIHHIHDVESEEEALRIERELHFHFQDSHIRGEWFQLSVDDLPKVKQMFSSLIMFTEFAPDGWSLKRKGCDEFTAEVCRTARNGIGLSTKELAEKAGVGIQVIERFEARESTPSVDSLEAIKNSFEELGIEFLREQTGKKLRVLI